MFDTNMLMAGCAADTTSSKSAALNTGRHLYHVPNTPTGCLAKPVVLQNFPFKPLQNACCG